MGCQTKEYVSVRNTDIITVDIPESLLEECAITPPPEKDWYLNASWEDKENILTAYTILLIEDLAICNNQINSIKETVNKQKEIMQNNGIQ